MIKQQTFCDGCGEEFTNPYWDDQPSNIRLTLSVPAQIFESRDASHVCKICRTKIVELWDSIFKK